jgi:hypothetical protein
LVSSSPSFLLTPRHDLSWCEYHQTSCWLFFWALPILLLVYIFRFSYNLISSIHSWFSILIACFEIGYEN